MADLHFVGAAANVCANPARHAHLMPGLADWHTHGRLARAGCRAPRVPLSLASEAHELAEVGEFTPHLRVLAEAGFSTADLPRVLLPPR